MKKVALVTGATRGLGWGAAKALAKQKYSVVLLGRDLETLRERKEELLREGSDAEAMQIDLAHPSSIDSCVKALLELHPEGVDLLINNAGVFLDSQEGYDRGAVEKTLQVNALGPLQFAIGLEPLLRKRKGVVVNVSSGMGGLKEMGAGYPGYRISKTALNAITRYLSQEWHESGIRVNSVCPGWVKTDMGGPNAERSIEEGVKSILWAAEVPSDGPTGGFFRDGKRLEW